MLNFYHSWFMNLCLLYNFPMVRVRIQLHIRDECNILLHQESLQRCISSFHIWRTPDIDNINAIIHEVAWWEGVSKFTDSTNYTGDFWPITCFEPVSRLSPMYEHLCISAKVPWSQSITVVLTMCTFIIVLKFGFTKLTLIVWLTRTLDWWHLAI